MQSSSEVVPLAAEGHVKQLAIEYDVTTSRMYEIVGKDCPYPKLIKLCRALAPHNPQGVRQIQADFNARIEAMLTPYEQTSPTAARIHDECSDVTSALLRGEGLAKQKIETLEAIAVLMHKLACIQRAEGMATDTDGIAELRAQLS